MKKYLLAGAASLGLLGAAVAAPLVFPLQSSVTGTEVIQNALNPTGAYFTAAQLATYAVSTWPALNTAVTFGGVDSFTAVSTTFGSTNPTHLISGQTTAPALTSCGSTGAAIVGSDTAGHVTVGGTASTSCIVTFNVAYTGAPACVVTSESQLTSFAYSVTNTAITVAQTSTASNKFDYVCVAQAGG